MQFKTNTINETELVYSLLREKYPSQQIEISYDYREKTYIALLTEKEYKEDPVVNVDFSTRTIYGDTDSIFVEIKFNRQDFVKNRQDTFKLATICGDNVTDIVFNRKPIVLEFEKVFQPFVLLTKKRYIGKKFENMKDPMKLKTVTTAGIALTRRNYSQLVKKCYKEVIDCIMENGEDSLETSCDLYKKYIDRIDNYQVDYDDLVVSAQIGKEYSCKHCKEKVCWILKCEKCHGMNPQKTDICQVIKKDKMCKNKFKCLHSFSLAHINLAQKLLERNEEIQIGDRIQYLFVESTDKSEQKNELAEDFNYAKTNKLKFNRVAYLEQVAKPLCGFFKVVLKDREDLMDDLLDYTNEKLLEFGGKKLRVSDFKLDLDD